jgi:hypothetical protein
MDPLQFTLFFAAVLIGYALLHVRVARFEGHLRKLDALQSIDDRMRQIDDRLLLVSQSVDRIRLDRAEAQLERLHNDLEDLREVTANWQHAVVQIPAPAAATPAAEPPAEPAAARILAAVENRLLEQGYRDVRVLNELAGVDGASEVELQVECWRGGMPAKGRVLVRNGAVRDVALQSVVQMFP